MKRIVIVLAALTLPGCAAIAAVEGAATTISVITKAFAPTADKVVVPTTQALIIAHNAYQGTAAIVTLAVQSGLVPRAMLPQIAALNDRAKLLLDRADRGQDVAANVAEAMNTLTTMQSLAGK